MDVELAVALVGAAGGAVTSVAGGVVNRIGRTRLERDADLYGKLAGMDGGPFDGSVLERLKSSIGDRVLGVRFRRALAALAIEAGVYLLAICAATAILLAVESIDGEQARAYAALMLVALFAFAITLLAFQAAFMYREILGVLERRDANKKERERARADPGRGPGEAGAYLCPGYVARGDCESARSALAEALDRNRIEGADGRRGKDER